MRIELGNPLYISKLMAVAIRFDAGAGRNEVREDAHLARLSHVTRARITQIMNPLDIGQDIPEAILCLPRTVQGVTGFGKERSVPLPRSRSVESREEFRHYNEGMKDFPGPLRSGAAEQL